LSLMAATLTASEAEFSSGGAKLRTFSSSKGGSFAPPSAERAGVQGGAAQPPLAQAKEDTRAAEPAAAAGPLLLVANKGDHTLGIVDPQAGRQLATVEESGITGHEVIASPDGLTAYVPIYGNSGVGRPGTDGQTLDVIDIAARR